MARIDPGFHGVFPVGDQVANLAVNGHHVLWLHDVVGIEQFARGGVTGHVNLRITLVHDLRAQTNELVDDAPHRVFVAGNQGGRQHHRVALADRNRPMSAVGNPRQGGHRFALRAGSHVHAAFGGQGIDVLEVNQHPVRHGHVTGLRGDGHIAFHRPPHQGDLAVRLRGGVQHLLHPVDVGGKRCHDNLAGSVVEYVLEDGSDFPFGGNKSRDLGIRGVYTEQVDPGLPPARESTQVGNAPVQGQLVHLKVPGNQRGAGFCTHHDRQGVGNRVVYSAKLQVERSQVEPLALCFDPQVRG